MELSAMDDDKPGFFGFLFAVCFVLVLIAGFWQIYELGEYIAEHLKIEWVE